MRRSTATAPRPSQNGRYADTKGTTTSIHRIGANESATTVTTWMARNTSTSSETLRCTNSTTKRGHVGLLQRNDVKIPSSTLAVRNPRVTTPVARATYHVTEPPESARTGCTSAPTRLRAARARVALRRIRDRGRGLHRLRGLHGRGRRRTVTGHGRRGRRRCGRRRCVHRRGAAAPGRRRRPLGEEERERGDERHPRAGEPAGGRRDPAHAVVAVGGSLWCHALSFNRSAPAGGSAGVPTVGAAG